MLARRTMDDLDTECARRIAAAAQVQAAMRKCVPAEQGRIDGDERPLQIRLAEVLTALAVLQWAMGYPEATAPSEHALRPLLSGQLGQAGPAVALQPELGAQVDQAGTPMALQPELGALAAEGMHAAGHSAEIDNQRTVPYVH